MITIQPNIAGYKTAQKRESFNGCDGRQLRAVIMTLNERPIVEEVDKIGQMHGFKVLWLNVQNKISKLCCTKNFVSRYVQDDIMMGAKRKIICDYTSEELARTAGKQFHLKYEVNDKCIPGGDCFLIRNGEKEELFVGQKRIKNRTVEELKQIYNAQKVHLIPPMDYHLDLFIRPLEDKKVLVCDDKYTLTYLRTFRDKLSALLKEGNTDIAAELQEAKDNVSVLYREFKLNCKKNKKNDSQRVQQVLRNAGYEPVSVPGRIYSISELAPDSLVHDLNYMNSIVHKNQNGDLVYITNKSEMDRKLGITQSISERSKMSFEKMFTDAVSPYIKNENIYFVSGKDNSMSAILKDEAAGIHCLCAEVPF